DGPLAADLHLALTSRNLQVGVRRERTAQSVPLRLRHGQQPVDVALPGADEVCLYTREITVESDLQTGAVILHRYGRCYAAEIFRRELLLRAEVCMDVIVEFGAEVGAIAGAYELGLGEPGCCLGTRQCAEELQHTFGAMGGEKPCDQFAA